MDSFFHGRGRHTPYHPDGYGVGRAPVLELLVPMCCHKCEEKVYEEMMELRGVQGVMVDQQAQRVIVHGFVDPIKALKKAKKVKRDSQLWSGEQYGRDFFSSPKYRRSAYRAPSLYRSSSLEYRPSQYRHEYREPSVYRSSYNRYTPSYGRSYEPSYGRSYEPSYGRSYEPSYGSSYGPSYGHQPWPAYDDMYSSGYSPVVTNPYYVKHIESEYY